ncbi:hypothetical protein FQN53_008562 [Emmonsiellopsis sp. PD_33]|nr:hypothetical protein FQN53_008562 [Emmonsiellopsis sp. PD_33]
MNPFILRQLPRILIAPGSAASVARYVSLSPTTRGRRIFARGKSDDAAVQSPIPTSNNEGEQILFNETPSIPGYTFVPITNLYMMKNCRKAARTADPPIPIYAHHSTPTARRKLGHPRGLFVPTTIVAQVRSEFEKLRARLDEQTWRKLDELYPLMPAEDRAALAQMVTAKNADAVANFSPHIGESTAWAYVRERYTAAEHVDISAERDSKAVARMHNAIERVLSSWSC